MNEGLPPIQLSLNEVPSQLLLIERSAISTIASSTVGAPAIRGLGKVAQEDKGSYGLIELSRPRFSGVQLRRDGHYNTII